MDSPLLNRVKFVIRYVLPDLFEKIVQTRWVFVFFQKTVSTDKPVLFKGYYAFAAY